MAEGWVRSRDFPIGLAIIQAFPGPHFNCELATSPLLDLIFINTMIINTMIGSGGVSTAVAVYLSALAARYTACPSAVRRAVLALIGLLGSRHLRHLQPGDHTRERASSRSGDTSAARARSSRPSGGSTPLAVGLIWTAVYRLPVGDRMPPQPREDH